MAAALTTTPGAPSTSLQRLHHVEKRIVHTVELAGGVMEELAKMGGPRQDVVAVQCQEFMQAVKEIQTTVREEIKSMCEYRPYEHSDYPARTTAETSVKKLDCALRQMGAMQDTITHYGCETNIVCIYTQPFVALLPTANEDSEEILFQG